MWLNDRAGGRWGELPEPRLRTVAHIYMVILCFGVELYSIKSGLFILCPFQRVNLLISLTS